MTGSIEVTGTRHARAARGEGSHRRHYRFAVTAVDVLLLLGGFVLLVFGGEMLVRGASGIARAVGLSPLIVGLTVVSFATSAPELAVTLDAAVSGSPGLAIGNVVGSNIANILLVLGVSALVTPLVVRSRVVRLDVPVMIAMSVALLLMSLDGTISTLDGALLLSALVLYVVRAIMASRRAGRETPEPDSPSEEIPDEQTARPLWRDALTVAVGVGMLVVGAGWLVDSATVIAGSLGVSDLVIGLTVVAIGTSLPELATSVVAVRRGQRDLAVGNVVGSNIFNIGSVIGLTAIISPGIPVADAAIAFDIPFMVAVAVALLPIVYTGAAVARWEGGLFLAYYVAYTGYLLLDSADHDVLPQYSAVMLGFVVPITVLTLVLLSLAEVRRRAARRAARRAVRERRSSP